MSRGSRIVSIGQDQAPAQVEAVEQAEPPVLELTAEEMTTEEDGLAPRRSMDWLPAAVAILAAVGWTGFFFWSVRDEMLAAPPEVWIGWIYAWTLPVVLICVLWLVIMRNSRREARLFGDVARSLGFEASRLEERLVKVNQELSLAREFIAAQSRDLETLGRLATERLSKNADRLQELITDNSAQLDCIGTVSVSALENMERLRGQLPVIASSAKDVTNNIANAGRTAHSQLLEMANGFNRLNEFGLASERHVAALRAQIEEGLTEFTRHAEQLDEIARTRFAALAEKGAEFRAQLDDQEVEALASVRSRATALAEELEESRELLDRHEAETLTSLRARLAAVRDESGAIARALREAENTGLANWRAQVARMDEDLRTALASLEKADSKTIQSARARLDELVEEAERLDANLVERNRRFDEEMERRRSLAAEREAAALAQIGRQFEALDREIAARRERHVETSAALAAHSEEVAARLEEVEAGISAIAAHGGETEERLANGLRVLTDHLSASRDVLAGTDHEIANLTDASVRLLELIQASAQHSREDLSQALASGEQRLESVESRIFAMRDAMNEAGECGEGLSAHVLTTSEAVRSAMIELDGLHDNFEARSETHKRHLADLQQTLSELDGESAALAARARSELSGAIEQLAGAAREAVSSLEQHGASAVGELAGKLVEESREAIDKAMHARAAEIAGELEQAATHAAGVSREAAMQLRDQLAKVNELAGNLEQRVAHARQRAEDDVDNDFSRRVALITDSLNSNAIDITKALSNEVSDTAWAAYLRGDRGIFTRRAVTLLDSAEAKAITQLYVNDRDFSGHVNRYIHDFEAMLRQLLSTRDGHALGVTLLSSDMGKLYVALAQAIERLRS